MNAEVNKAWCDILPLLVKFTFLSKLGIVEIDCFSNLNLMIFTIRVFP